MAVSPDNTGRDQRTGGDELPQWRVKRLLHVLGVVLVGGFPVQRTKLQRLDGQALALEPAEDLPHQPAAHRVWLQQHERTLRHLYLLSFMPT